MDSFCPFALTCTGQLGAHALKLLDYLRVTYGLMDSVWDQLCRLLSRTCLVKLAEIIAFGRTRLRLSMLNLGVG